MPNQITVNTDNNQINIDEGGTRVITIVGAGPQGPAGPSGSQGPSGSLQDTGSLLTTASISDAIVTFTKGDGSTFDIEVNNVSSSISSSYALTASYAENAGGSSDPFPYTGSAIVSGSLIITGSADISGSVTASSITTPQGTINQLTSSYAITASYAENAGGSDTDWYEGATYLTASKDVQVTGSLVISSSNDTSSLVVYGSGSNPVFLVQGSAGELFSISDSLSGSLFSVHNEFGLPILETFSDDRTLIGTYTARSLYTTAVIVSSDSSITQSLYSISTGSDYDGAFFEYTAKSASNARAGTITAVWSESVVQYTETTTADIGSTSGVELLVEQSQSSYHLHLNTPTNGWKVKTIIRSI